MKRGKPFEMVLAALGTGAWLTIAVAGLIADSPIDVVIGGGLALLSVVEIIRWQHGVPSMAISNRRRAARLDPAVPSTAWFGLGGLSAVLLLGVIAGLITPADSPAIQINRLVIIAVYLVAGGLVSWLLARNFDRREREARRGPGKAEIPPPPPPAAASVDAHSSGPAHEVEGPTATFYHLQREHGVDLDPFSSRQVLDSTHAGLHDQAVSPSPATAEEPGTSSSHSL